MSLRTVRCAWLVSAMLAMVGARAGLAWAPQDGVAGGPEAQTGKPPAETSADRGDEDGLAGESDSLTDEQTLGRFQQLLERRPLHAQAFAGLVKHFTEQGKLPELVKEYEEKSASLPDSVNLKVVLARLYLRAGQPEKAAELLDKIEAAGHQLGRDESKWLVFKAEVYQKNNRGDAAEGVLNEALGKAKTVSEKLRLAEALADLHLAAGDKEKAAAALVQTAGEYRDNFLHRKRMADALAQRDLHDAAVTQFRELLPLTEGKPDQRCETLRQLGRSLERLSRTQDAIDAYSEAVNLLSGGHWLQQELHERIVALYRASGRLEDLVKYCRTQLERAPEQTGMRVLLADVLSASGDNDGAKRALEEAVQLFPKERMLSERRVQFLERTGDAAGAAAEYERIIAQQPDDVELYIAYGQFLANNKQLEAAKNQWKHVLNGELADALLAQRLGALFEPYELLDDAVDCYERAIALDPAQSESYAALARLWFVRGDKDRTLATLKRMRESAPDEAGNQAAACQVAAGLGMTDEALASISRACELAPTNAEYQSNRADLLVQAGRLDDGLTVRREVLALLTQPGQLAQAVNVLVSMYASANKLATLRAAEEARLAEKARDTIALLLLARAADFERDFATAEKWLRRLLEAEPNHEEARHQLAKLLEATGDIDGAVDGYRKLIDMHPARARQWYQAIADLKLRYDDKSGAVEAFKRIVQTSPGNATVLKDVAEQLSRMGELEESIDHYEQSLRLQPERHEIRLKYADTLSEAGRLDDALAAYKAVALQRNDRDSALEAMGKLHENAARVGALDELLDELQSQVEANPENSLVARTLAELLIREYEYTRAMELIELVLRHQPRDAELQLARGELFRRLAKFDDALETYRRVLRVPNIDRDFVLGEMGKACFEAGRIEQARTFWRQVSHKLYAGSLLRNNGLLTDAIAVFLEGIRLKPDDYGLHRNLIKALAAAGKTDEALDAARRLLDLEPDNVMNIRDLAKAYLDRGNRTAASEVAARLFSAAVQEKKTGGGQPASQFGSQATSVAALSMQSTWASVYGGWGGQAPRNNLDAAVQFFRENGLTAELQEIVAQQLASQPENSLLKLAAVGLFSEFGNPEKSLTLLRELESAPFPVEQQAWLGQSSQRDFIRLREYQLIASKPALRDIRLAELERKPETELTRDELLELAIVRQAQGLNDQALELLRRAVDADQRDVVALSVLANLLLTTERFADAEPFVTALIEALTTERERLAAEMIERVRRDFVRSLPLQLQLRVTDELLRDIALKWTLGQSFAGEYAGITQTIGVFRARLMLATILVKTGRVEPARQIWKDLSPTHPADVDGWTMLAGVAQLHDQRDLALAFYEKAMQSARVLAEDPLYQRIYGGSLSQVWYGAGEQIDSTFNKVVESFEAADKLIALYDFLRDTDQTLKARRVAQQCNLYDKLKTLYQQRLDEARATFKAGTDDPLRRSIPYLTAACKLAELHDQTGDWPAAEAIYRQYLDEFPDELGLLVTLGEAAEKQNEYDAALDWEKKTVACKERLARRAREWRLRELPTLPSIPQVLGDNGERRWEWPQRWGRNQWYGWNATGQLEVWPSWVRIAELYLSVENVLAAGNAMERAINAAGTERDEVARQLLGTIRQRQLGPKLLSVLRALAVQLPTDEATQLAFADSLEANDRTPAAAEVYQRMIRRGVSDVGKLAQVKQRLAALSGESAAEDGAATLDSLEAEVAADPADAGNKLRLAKAYYYSLHVERALEIALQVLVVAPHLEGLHDLLIEIYTVQGDSKRLVEALRTKIQRVTDAADKAAARRRLAEELLAGGETEAALGVLKELTDPKNPESYETLGLLLQYFGRYDEAIEQFEQASRSQAGGQWGGGDRGGTMLVRARLLRGDIDGAADKLLAAVDLQARQSVQYGGLSGMWLSGDTQDSTFQPYLPLLALEPKLGDALETRLAKRRAENPDDPQAAKLLFALYRATGRAAQSEKLLEEMAGRNVADQSLLDHLIDRAIARQEYDKAITMAEAFIAGQPKPAIPPGLPPQYAGMMSVMTPRNMMLCRLGDVYWKMSQPEKAFECYKRVLDEKVDESRIAYAMICMMRDRRDDAGKIVAEALKGQKVQTPGLLQFRAALAALDGKTDVLFDDLARAAEIGEGAADNPFGGGNPDGGVSQLAAVARQTGQLDRFVEFMNQRIQKNPSDWNQYATLARVLRESGRMQDALDVLERAGKVKGLRRDALQQKLQWVEAFAPQSEQIAMYEELIELTEKQTRSSGGVGSMARMFGGRQPPEESNASQQLRDRLGDLYWEANQQDKAIAVWTERLDAKSPATLFTLGKRLLQKKAYEKSAAYFHQALALQPDDASVHRALAGLAYQAGDHAALLRHLTEVFESEYEAVTKSDEQQQDPYGFGYEYDGPSQARSDGSDERLWATALKSDPQVTAALNNSTNGADQAAPRLMLAVLTGDWSTVDAELTTRLPNEPYDPMLWSLYARLKERRGEWEAAIGVWEKVRRLKRTSIPKHRDQLKLVLAGRQVREAAAGEKDADGTAGAAPAAAGGITTYYPRYRGYYGGGRGDADTQRLASLYRKVGKHEQAERLRLVSDQNSIAWVLPELAVVAWKQGQRERGLDLYRLAVTVGDDNRNLQQYASMLAESGSVDAAAALLIHAYRCQAPISRRGLQAMMGGGMPMDMEENDSQGESYSASLYDVLRKADALDATIKRLQEQSSAAPDDDRLAKLLLSLLMRDRRWDDARAALERQRASLPDDKSLLTELFRVEVQRRDWAAATRLVHELNQQQPDSAARWRACGAFLRLLQEDRAGAAAMVEPDLASVAGGLKAGQIGAILGGARDYERLTSYLKREHDRGTLDDDGCLLLVRLFELGGKWNEAVTLAMQRLWDQPAPLNPEHRAYVALARSARGAKVSAARLTGDPGRPEDAGLIALVTDGPAAGQAAFQQLVGQHPDRPNARRGLIFASELAGDAATAARAGDELLAWLQPRVNDLARPPTYKPLADAAAAYVEQMKAGGLNTSMILGASLQFSSIIEQFFGGGQNDAPSTYVDVWNACAAQHPDRLLRSGEPERAAALLQTLAIKRDAPNANYNPYGNMRYLSSWSATTTRTSWNTSAYNENTNDPEQSLRKALHRHFMFAPLAAAYDGLRRSVSSEESSLAGDAFAAIGRADDAREWRRRQVDAAVFELLCADAPQADSEEAQRWRWYSGDDLRERHRLRTALAVRVRAPAADDDEFEGEYLGQRGGLAWLARADDDAKARLLALADGVGPGWGEGATVAELLWHYHVERQPAATLALLDRVFDADQLVRSDRLAQYLAACLEVQDYDRAAKTIDAVAKLNPAADDDVQLARLTLMRMQGQTAKADSLEHALLARCSEEPLNPARMDEALVEGLGADDFGRYPRMPQRYNRYANYMSYLDADQPLSLRPLETAAALAEALNVPYAQTEQRNELTLPRIADVYAGCRLFADAARIVDAEIAGDAAKARPRARAARLQRKADWLRQAGQKESAASTAAEVEAFWKAEAAAHPLDPTPMTRLAALYASKAGGRDYARALEANAAARSMNPGFDRDGVAQARYLYELGRYDDAWRLYDAAVKRGASLADDELYRAGLSAAKAGAAGRAAEFLRLALWRAPSSALASAAREVTHD